MWGVMTRAFILAIIYLIVSVVFFIVTIKFAAPFYKLMGFFSFITSIGFAIKSSCDD